MVPSPNNKGNITFLDAKVAVGCESCNLLLKRLHKKEEVEVRLRSEFRRMFDAEPNAADAEKDDLRAEVSKLKRIIAAMKEAQEDVIDITPHLVFAPVQTVVALAPPVDEPVDEPVAAPVAEPVAVPVAEPVAVPEAASLNDEPPKGKLLPCLQST